MKNEQIIALKKTANNARRLIVKMLTCAQSGHPGGSLSCIDILTVLYFHVMKHDSKNPDWKERDRFHLSKGHGCPALYSTLHLSGYFAEEELWNLRKLGALLQGHTDRKVPGIDVGSGSLGQGLSVAMGMAIAARLDKNDCRVYCLMGDGESQEGNIWEAAMAAVHFKLDNLCAVTDHNGLQIDGQTKDVMSLEPIADKWRAFGWNVIECDGHDVNALIEAFDKAKTVKGKPTMIVADTVKGKGISFMEHVVNFHGVAPCKDECQIALDDLQKIDDSLEEEENK